jgi:uncharacterized membrane protein
VALRSPTLGAFVDGYISPLTRGEAVRLAVARRLVNSLATLFPAALAGLAVGLVAGVLQRGPRARVEAPAETEPPAQPVIAAAASGGAVAAAGPTPRPWRRQRAPLAAPAVGGEALLRSPAVLMALLMMLTGALLLVGPEWLYLRDNFGWRMNTIFKFYFQTWALWALAGAFGLWHIFQHARAPGRRLAGLIVSLAVAVSLVYTLPSLYSKTGGFAGEPTLNGMTYFAQRYPDEWAAIEWLRENVSGMPVIVEASGGAYLIEEGRVATGTGLPTVMGWVNHEGQWRGEYYSNVAERPSQIETLYQVRDWGTALDILDKYDIEYVIVGPEERKKYNPVYTPKFDAYMDVVFETDNLTIYRRKLLPTS